MERFEITENKFNRTAQQLAATAKETVEVRFLKGKFDVKGSELAILRLFYSYRNSYKAGEIRDIVELPEEDMYMFTLPTNSFTGSVDWTEFGPDEFDS